MARVRHVLKGMTYPKRDGVREASLASGRAVAIHQRAERSCVGLAALGRSGETGAYEVVASRQAPNPQPLRLSSLPGVIAVDVHYQRRTPGLRLRSLRTVRYEAPIDRSPPMPVGLEIAGQYQLRDENKSILPSEQSPCHKRGI